MIKGIVVGVGHLGSFHAQKLLSLTNHVDLVALIDNDPDRIKSKFPDQKIYATLSEFLQSGQEFDFAIIATPTNLHYEFASELIKLKKHVLVEKPLTNSLSDSEKLVSLAKDNCVWLGVGKIERHRAHSVLKDIKETGFIECHRLSPFPKRSTDIDVVLDLMIHDIDLMLSIVDSPIDSVSASGFPVLTDKADIANARFEFKNGCVANLTSSRISVSTTRKFRIFAPDLYISLDLAEGNYAKYIRINDEPNPEKSILPEFGELDVQDALLKESLDFVEAIRDNRPPLVQGFEGLQAQKVAEMVRKDIQVRMTKGKN